MSKQHKCCNCGELCDNDGDASEVVRCIGCGKPLCLICATSTAMLCETCAGNTNLADDELEFDDGEVIDSEFEDDPFARYDDFVLDEVGFDEEFGSDDTDEDNELWGSEFIDEEDEDEE